jgi:hypothetical protein
LSFTFVGHPDTLCAIAQEVAAMKIGVSLSILAQAGRSDVAVYRDHLELGDLAEPLGYDSIFALEHQFTGYSMSPGADTTTELFRRPHQARRTWYRGHRVAMARSDTRRREHRVVS